MEEIVKKVSRVRSPGYPIIDLREAIERVKILWKEDKTNPIPREAAAKHLGYENAGGYGGRILAALKHFDLIYLRENDIILTENAIDLMLRSPEEEAYRKIVKESALKPNIYETLFSECKGEIPSDQTLKIKLIKEFKFNADKIDRFISDFRSTIEFAGLTKIEEEKPKDEKDDNKYMEVREAPIIPNHAQKPTVADRPAIVAKHYPIPLSKGMTAVIGFEALPVDRNDISKIKKWLDLFEDELTQTEQKES